MFQRDVVSDLDSLVQLTNSLLSNKNTKPCVVIVDAINQVMLMIYVWFINLRLKKTGSVR